MTMIETIARALYAVRLESAAAAGLDTSYDWESENNFYREYCLSEARTVLEAMRELPDTLRWEHGYDRSAFAPESTGVSSIQFDPKPIWERLIDGALAEGAKE